MKNADGTVTQRKDFTPGQVKQVVGFEKSYTSAVNKLASNADRAASVKLRGGGKEQAVKAGFVARALAGRMVIASPSETGGGRTGDNVTTLSDRALSGVGTIQGVRPHNAEELRQIAITHEGMHDTYVDNTRGNLEFKPWNSGHQDPFNRAAQQLLGLSDSKE